MKFDTADPSLVYLYLHVLLIARRNIPGVFPPQVYPELPHAQVKAQGGGPHHAHRQSLDVGLDLFHDVSDKY